MIEPLDWTKVLDQAGPDPLHILRSTAAVMSSASDVTIAADAIDEVADSLAAVDASPEWDIDLHYRATGPDGDERTAMWILVLDALNFCFWGAGDDPQVRWRVEWNGDLADGYVALVYALKGAVEEGVPLHDPSWLAHVEAEDVSRLLRPADGHPGIPLMPNRLINLRELGEGLLRLQDISPATRLIRNGNGSAIALIQDIVRRFPSFNDVATWNRAGTGLPGNEVRFYKRAQILAGDLAGGLTGSPLGTFADINQLTAFADYKVPQVLRHLGILRYSPSLSNIIASRTYLPAGSPEEIEVRAGTIWGCELLRQALVERGRMVSAHELDWLLWTQGQSLPDDVAPYHRTLTKFY